MRARPAVLACLAAAAAVLVFWPSLSHGWLDWDDTIMVSMNPHIRGFGWDQFRWAFTASPTGAYQPLAYLSYGLDFAFWGLDPRGYHLSSVLLHAMNAALVFLVSRRLLGLAVPPRPGETARSLDVAAFISALVFALHPLRVESVSWVAERRDPLCGVFWLGAILSYLRARRPGRPSRSLIPTHALFAAACLAKGVAVTLPLVLLIMDVWPLRRRWVDSVAEKVPMLFLGGALGILAVWRQGEARAAWTWADHGFAARSAQTVYALVFYVRKTLWPSGLSPFYELRPPLDPLQARFLFSAAVVAAFVAASWRWRRERPWLAATGAAYAVVLLPVSGIMQAGAQLVADRYSYLSCMVLALLAGAIFRAGLRRARFAALAVAAAVIVPLAATCVAQQAYWRDSESLWLRTLALDPDSPTAWLNLGAEWAGKGSTARAADAFRRALAADPACPPLVERLSSLVEREPLDGSELLDVRGGLSTRPVCRKALADLGAACAQLGRNSEARRYLRMALTADPDDLAARRNLGRLERETHAR